MILLNKKNKNPDVIYIESNNINNININSKDNNIKNKVTFGNKVEIFEKKEENNYEENNENNENISKNITHYLTKKPLKQYNKIIIYRKTKINQNKIKIIKYIKQ